MRLVFGRGKLVTAPSGFAIEAPRLHVPALILPSLAGAPVPDLTAYLGQIISVTGQLAAPGENVNSLGFHFNDITASPQDITLLPLCGVISGNLGNQPEINPKGDRISGSLAFHTDRATEKASWLRLSALKASAISTFFADREKGSPLIVVGEFESYVYKDKPNLHLWLTAFEAQQSAAYKAPESLATSYSEGDCAPTESHAFEEA